MKKKLKSYRQEALPPPPPPDSEVIEVLNAVEDDVETAEIIIDSEDDWDKRLLFVTPFSGVVEEADAEVVFMVVEICPAFPVGRRVLKYLVTTSSILLLLKKVNTRTCDLPVCCNREVHC